MKSKLCLFLTMFLIWCLLNDCTIWVLLKLRLIDSDYYSPIYILTAFLFSAIAAIWPGYFKQVLVFILVIELCLLVILWIQGKELDAEYGRYNVGYDRITFFNASFFVLVTYLTRVGAYRYGYYAGWLGLPFGLTVLLGEMILIGLSLILVLPIRKLSIWLTERWTGEELSHPGSGYLS
jgi:hypothetical protein